MSGTNRKNRNLKQNKSIVKKTQNNVTHINSYKRALNSRNSSINLSNKSNNKNTDIKKPSNSNKKHKRKNVYSGRVVTLFVFSLIVLYLSGYAFYFITKDTISFDTIQYGSIDAPKTAEGIVIRNETVYSTPVDGVVSYNVADDEKVKKGSIICSIKDETVVASMEDNLEHINKDIIGLQESRDEMSWFAEDVKRVNKQIKDIIDENSNDYAKLKISNIYELKSNIQKKINTRNQMLLSENKGSLQNLAKQREEQENELSKNIVSISANEGGVVSYYIDNLEQTFTLETMEKLSKEQTTMKPSNISDTKTQVNAKDNVLKIVNSNEWYIASYIPNNYIESWKQNDTITIFVKRSDSSIPVEASIHKLEQFEKETYVILKITKNMIDYINERNITFEINKSQVGFKIPNTAIVEKTLLEIPMDYVEEGIIQKVKEDGTIIDVGIAISNSDKDKNIVYTPIQFGVLEVGSTIHSPKGLTENYTINNVMNSKGVYIINTGIAEFQKINTDKSIQNSTHTIIDPTINTNINIYDRIITDTKNIEKEQKIYK